MAACTDCGCAAGESRAKRWRKRALWTIVVLVALWLASSWLVAELLVRRHHARFDEPVPIVAWTTFESVRLSTSDGAAIGAWFGPHDHARASVLVLHGLGGARSGMLEKAAVFARCDCDVMLLSLRAHGDSSGDRNDFGPASSRDVIAAVEFLERRAPGSPIVIDGASLGASAAAFAARELGGRVNGWIFECLFADLTTAIRNRLEAFLPPVLDHVAYLGFEVAAPFVLPDMATIAPREAVRAIPAGAPVLVMCGGRDRRARAEETQAIYANVAAHARLVTFESAEHDRLRESDPARYELEIARFLDSVHR